MKNTILSVLPVKSVLSTLPVRSGLSILSILSLLLFSSGCVSKQGSSRISDQTLINKIKKGKTTKKEIRTWFGEPSGKRYEKSSEGWDYSYHYSKVTPLIFIGAFLPGSNIGVDVEVSTLSVIFDNNTGKVSNFGHAKSD